MNGLPQVLVVIVNYCTPALTLECIRSLGPALAPFPTAQIVLVDNGSEDDSADQFRASPLLTGLGARLHLVLLSHNVGYAAGNNAAIRPALAFANPPEYIWLLNSDTLVQPDALTALVSHMETHPRAGLAGSCLQDQDGEPQRAAFRFPGIAGEWEAAVKWRPFTRLLERWVIALPPPQATMQTDWVPGASMLVRRTLLDRIGLLDQDFFLYYEDVDLNRRARNAGWETWYVAESRVVHRVGSGVSGNRHVPAARRLYYLKHHGRLYWMGVRCVSAVGDLLWRLCHPTVRRGARELSRNPVERPRGFSND